MYWAMINKPSRAGLQVEFQPLSFWTVLSGKDEDHRQNLFLINSLWETLNWYLLSFSLAWLNIHWKKLCCALLIITGLNNFLC